MPAPLTTRVLWLACWAFALGGEAFGQSEVVRLPMPVEQFWQARALINPAAVGAGGRFDAYGGHRRFLSGWGNSVYATYAHAGAAFGENAAGSFHAAGASFFSEQEGPYLNRSRGYALYAYHQRLGARWRLAAGGALGIASYQVRATPVSGGGGDVALDGDIGVYAYDGDWYGGLSVNQLFNATLQPISERTRLVPVYSLTLRRKTFLTRLVEIEPFALLRWADLPRPLEPQLEANVGASAIVSEAVGFTISYRHERRLTAAFLLERIRLAPGWLRFGLSYSVPVEAQSQPSAYELYLRFQIDDDS